jgi:hypothetical protein
VEFEWDEEKASENLRKHKVSFTEAATVFGDRLTTAGLSSKSRLLIVSHRDLDNRIRIISARRLTRTERKMYEEKTKH